ncbi:paraquat-inducible protein A [Ostreibacterium oceani]|nr:paraquat-inducible protein A [Ostreibacterium oceani]
MNDTHCPLCHRQVHLRTPQSLSKTWAYLITAIIVFIPANVFPIMAATAITGSQSDTILSGIWHLWQSESYLIALIVFIASFVTPVFKILSMAYLCYTCQIRSSRHILFRTKLYHFSEIIGRWSMIDVFVVALLGALIQMGLFAKIEPNVGIVFFTALVVLTMLAVSQFDPRLIWDLQQDQIATKNSNQRPHNT